MAKGKDIMLKIAVIDDEEYYSELIRQIVCNWLMEKGCQGEIDCFDHADDFKTQIENGRCYDIRDSVEETEGMPDGQAVYGYRDAGYQRHGTGLLCSYEI